MLQQIVKDYKIIIDENAIHSKGIAEGGSGAPKGMIFHILGNNQNPISILDIGFGTGGLASLVKSNSATSHWHIDGIDGWESNCKNKELINKKLYRNIWHGLAQNIPAHQLAAYDIICLLDVIEHLDAETAKWLLRTLLTHMGEDAKLFISTPLWFYPQDSQQQGDLEEHLIGIPASSMMALIPIMYSINHPLIGGFVFNKKSLDFIDFFQPTHNKKFSFNQGVIIASAIGLQQTPGVLFKTQK